MTRHERPAEVAASGWSCHETHSSTSIWTEHAVPWLRSVILHPSTSTLSPSYLRLNSTTCFDFWRAKQKRTSKANQLQLCFFTHGAVSRATHHTKIFLRSVCKKKHSEAESNSANTSTQLLVSRAI